MKANLIPNSTRGVVIMAALIFLGEAAFIFSLSFLPHISFFTAGIINALLLAVIILTALYLLSRGAYQKVNKRMHLIDKALGYSNEAVLITDAAANIEYVNPAFCSITGYKKEEVLGRNPSIMKSGRHDVKFYKEMWESLNKTGQWQGEVWDRRKNGDIYPKWLSINTIKAKGEPVKYVGVFSDMTNIKQTEEYLDHLMHYDALTNVPNSILFRERLKQAMLHAGRSKKNMGIMAINLSNFKYVNDTFGYLAGDQILRDAAQRLVQAVSRHDTVARQGGDKFSVLLTELTDRGAAAATAKKIVDAIAVSFKFKGHEVYLKANIGIAIYMSGTDTVDDLLRNADIAMYRAKEMEDNRFQFYDPAMGNTSFERLSIEANLRQALEQEGLVLYYQPNVDLRTGRIFGMEALVRRQEHNWLAQPASFIKIAEESGLIIPIIKWTLQTACKQAKRWIDEGLPPLRLAVNIAATQFREQGLLHLVKDVLAESSLDPRYLELEITEKALMQDSAAAIRMMNEMKDMGIYLTIDDFGTGYSSLSYLKKLPVNKLKIDISFIREMTTDPNSALIVKAIIDLAHTLNLTVLAEGVEKKEQVSFLVENNCDEMQGFYFSLPLPAENFKKLILKEKHLTL